MLYYVHGLLEGSCGTIQLQDVQTAQYLFGCSYNYKQYTGKEIEMNGARGVRATSSHHWFAAVVCKMEITSREYYSFCVISSRVPSGVNGHSTF